MHKDTRIVFVHQGNRWYLPYVMRQAVSVNKSAHDVTLLGDTEHGDGVSTVPLEGLRSVWSDQFVKLYEHMSTNSERFELFCWLRWFYLLQYMQLEHVTHVLHLDTDALLYSSIQELHGVYGGMMTDCGLMVPEQDFSSFMWFASGHISYWTRAFLERFCDFVLRSFKDYGLTLCSIGQILLNASLQKSPRSSRQAICHRC